MDRYNALIIETFGVGGIPDYGDGSFREKETGVEMLIDHLGFVQENYFIADVPSKMGKEVYEIGYY